MTNRELVAELFDDLRRRFAQATRVSCSRCGSSPKVLILDYEDDDPRKPVALCTRCLDIAALVNEAITEQ